MQACDVGFIACSVINSNIHTAYNTLVKSVYNKCFVCKSVLTVQTDVYVYVHTPSST